MKPGEVTFGQYSSGNVQFVIPRYQRPYEWSKERWVGVWRDIVTCYKALEISIEKGTTLGSAHFMGSVILEEDGALPGGAALRRVVVDGQQRLITLLVLAAAIRDHDAFLRGCNISVTNDLAVITPRYGGTPVPRVELEKVYGTVYSAIAAGDFLHEVAEQHATHQLSQCYRFFRYQLWQGSLALEAYEPGMPSKPSRKKDAPHAGSYDPWGDAERSNPIDLGVLSSVLDTRLKILEIVLDSTDEQASLIFEAMNSKNTPLRQFDHLRNSIFVCMPTRREKFHETYWRSTEATLDGMSYSSLRNTPEDQFFYEYLISLGETRVSFRDLHSTFMERVYKKLGYPPSDQRTFETDFAAPFAEAALVYPIALGQTTNVKLPRKTFKVAARTSATVAELLTMSGGPAVPIVLRMLRANLAGSVTDADLYAGVRDIQSYLVRSMLAGRRFSPMRATFMQVSMRMGATTTLASLRTALRAVDWPSDPEVMRSVEEVELYKYGGQSMFPILRGIERGLAKRGAHNLPYGTDEDEYTIEHIFPQSDSTSKEWVQDIVKWNPAGGLSDMKVRRHVLGNLTAVTGYDNSANGRKSFAEKKRLIKKVAPIRLNDSVTSKSKWGPSEIDARTRYLAKVALGEWPRR